MAKWIFIWVAKDEELKSFFCCANINKIAQTKIDKLVGEWSNWEERDQRSIQIHCEIACAKRWAFEDTSQTPIQLNRVHTKSRLLFDFFRVCNFSFLRFYSLYQMCLISKWPLNLLTSCGLSFMWSRCDKTLHLPWHFAMQWWYEHFFNCKFEMIFKTSKLYGFENCFVVFWKETSCCKVLNRNKLLLSFETSSISFKTL